MANWVVNEGPKYFMLLLWIGINALLFALTYLKYDKNAEFVYLKRIIGGGLPVARGAAMILNFNCLLILLPVCRNLISLIRSKCKCIPSNFLRLLDKNITFHKCCAYMICFGTALHVGAHTFNFDNLITSWENSGVEEFLNNLEDGNGTTYINPIRKEGMDPVTELLKTVAGVSGIIITLALIIMVSSSTELIRRSYFEVFWFIHHLFIIFYIGVIVHGLQELLRAQYNMGEHDPEVCVREDWTQTMKCSQVRPQFKAKGAQTWKWVVGPMALYLIERCIRFYRSLQKVTISKIVKHPSRVLELQLKKSGFVAEPGQYIFLHCPSISQLEWHPFTLTSCPEEDFFSVHIRIVGDWTEALAKACDLDGSLKDVSKLPRVAVDGPFGTASTDCFDYTTCVFVGAGIGVTPFASILKSIWYQQQNKSTELKIKKVYFFWICPDTNAFEWFTDLLQSLEQQMMSTGEAGFLEYNIYLTRGWGKDEARNIALHSDAETDVITGLQQKMNFGRPNWDKLFADIAQAHPSTDVGVFFCGPAVLSHTLHRMSNQHSSDKTKVKFFYNKENF